MVTFSDGFRSANSDFGASPADYAFTGRFDWKTGGDWDQFSQFSSGAGSEYASKIGGAVHWQDGPDTPASSGTEQFAWTIDAMAHGDGWNAFAAIVGVSTDVDGGADTDDFGWLVQAACSSPMTGSCSAATT